MPNKTVIGTQFGDEGKGRIVDVLAKDADFVVRFSGGNNAGHTVIVGDEKYIFHCVPSSILYSECTSIIGGGTVLDLAGLHKELTALQAKNIPLNLKISPFAHIITQQHKARDAQQETSANAIGSTKRGIGPCYANKALRTGIRIIDLYQQSSKERLVEIGLDSSELKTIATFLRPFVADTQNILQKAIKDKKTILFEGAQGLMLDVDHGTYPYVTSSSTHPANAAISNGIPVSAIGQIIGISKGYCTRVGLGPFPTELHDATGEYLRTTGKEFGSTTGRPRRTGWLDLVQLKYAIQMSGTDQIILTKLDILAGMSELKVCTAYTNADHAFPNLINWGAAQPCYHSLPGFPKQDWSKIKEWEQLSGELRNYLAFIESYLSKSISMISLGPERNSLLEKSA